MNEHILISLTAIIVLAIGSQWLAWRLKFPSVLFLLVFGFLAGPVTNFLDPDALLGDLLMPMVSIAVAIILFEGSLTLHFKDLRAIGGALASLVSVGVLITWGLAAYFAWYVLDINTTIAVLLGAILVVTGPTVIGPLLRQIRPLGKVNDLLKWEGIVIDPIGALLTVLVFEAILAGEAQNAGTAVALVLGKTIVFGGLAGVLGAAQLVIFLKKFWVPDYLQETLSLALVVTVYLVSDLIQPESGLFAVTLMGILVANQKWVDVKHILAFKENLRILIIGILFIVLAARIQLEYFNILSSSIIVFLVLLILVVRPIAVWISSLGQGMNWREKLFVAWMAPRGIVAAAVASIFSMRLVEINMPQAELLVPVVFSVIVGTVAIYGLTAPLIARWLKVAQSDPQGVLMVGAHPWALEIANVLKANGFNVALIDTNRTNIYTAKMAGVAAYHCNVISENILNEIDLDGIGKLLALTSSDEANALAVLMFNEIFEREELYQLHPNQNLTGQGQLSIPQHLRGRYLFDDGVDFKFINTCHLGGSVVKITKLTEEFDFKQFRSHYGDLALPLFIITETNQLLVLTPDKVRNPVPGQKLVILVDPKMA
ncbi:MAG: cation:proton antiporter [Lentisphaeria bacterium]|nr:cation:proton antiporter [Candidatus Neomarinimicrobiota bacterium]MCF7842095.1 cation:proton antiporter [Lentisphaeria bacterium]